LCDDCAGTFLLAAAAARQAVLANYRAIGDDSIGAVHEAVTRKVDNLRAAVANAAFNKDVQAFVVNNGPTQPVDVLFKHMQVSSGTCNTNSACMRLRSCLCI
jgi:hypothetical protein